MLRDQASSERSQTPSSSPEHKITKKRAPWGRPLPQPRTSIPPRQRAKTEEEKEQRNVERVLRNRRSAHNSRERRRLQFESLQQKIIELESQLSIHAKVNATLNQQIAYLQRVAGVSIAQHHEPTLPKHRQSSPFQNTAPVNGNKQTESGCLSISMEPSSFTPYSYGSPPLPEPTLELAMVKQVPESRAQLINLDVPNFHESMANSPQGSENPILDLDWNRDQLGDGAALTDWKADSFLSYALYGDYLSASQLDTIETIDDQDWMQILREPNLGNLGAGSQNFDGTTCAPVNVVLVLALLSPGPGHQVKRDIARDSCRHLRNGLKKDRRLGVLVLSAGATWRLFEASSDEDEDVLYEERDIMAHMETEPNAPHKDWYLDR
ncbi:hypothetical protein NM208_g4291 [Fusarium decemcellulare]|uniref:Uncharacterized protein n=2 Tax=Fusarium decemcellulare TaxID=57161 RepID=A0ACC1S0Y2_9HYPO|nr:hypothetical protein NM208_g9600 [Fusarium decemcellulare]KAJ3542074.1 hypothetical protein NM208_g4291 [Fusarium decemcellulare]